MTVLSKLSTTYVNKLINDAVISDKVITKHVAYNYMNQLITHLQLSNAKIQIRLSAELFMSQISIISTFKVYLTRVYHDQIISTNPLIQLNAIRAINYTLSPSKSMKDVQIYEMKLLGHIKLLDIYQHELILNIQITSQLATFLTEKFDYHPVSPFF